MTTIKLQADITRCLAHGRLLDQTCPKADECARHVAIRGEVLPQTPVAYRCCDHSGSFALFIPAFQPEWMDKE